MRDLFVGWARSDWFAAAALVISMIAAGFSGLQARIAWAKHRREQAADGPVLEGSARPISEGYEITLVARNRSVEALDIFSIEAVSPHSARLIGARPYADVGKAKRRIDVDVRVPHSSATSNFYTIGQGWSDPELDNQRYIYFGVVGATGELLQVHVGIARASQPHRRHTQTLQIRLKPKKAG